MPVPPRVVPVGDCVVAVEFGRTMDEGLNARVHACARGLAARRLPGIMDIVPTIRSICVHIDPLLVGVADIAEVVAEADAGPTPSDTPHQRERLVTIPVSYGGDDGPDLDDVARHCGLSPDDVIALHTAGTYRVYMMGFTPGFPYLGGMPPQLATPRLPSPRTRVPAGSVGIAGPQTGVYPTESPGGWRIIGRTPVSLFDPHTDPPCLLDAGDRVRFVVVSSADRPADTSDRAPTEVGGSAGVIEVLEPGALTTVQDLGRFGYQRFGIPVAGAMDTTALRVANRLVGNADGAAGLEMTLNGPVLRFHVDAVVALTGARFTPRLNGRVRRAWQSLAVRAGDVVSFDPPSGGVRAYLAVGGGVDVPLVMASRSTYLPSGFGGYGGRALRGGDRLPVGQSSRVPLSARSAVRPAPPGATGPSIVRVVPGPDADAFTDAGYRTFFSGTYRLTTRSDRVGCRFDGPRIEHRAGADIVSDGTAFGVVQVAGDGLPMILMADRGTTGGYARIATVIGADLWKLAQARPGDVVAFEAVTRDDACSALLAQTAAAVDPCEDDDDVFDEDAGATWAAAAVTALTDTLAVAPSGGPRQRSSVRAGMAGLVVAVMVQPGATVREHETLAIIEAMKMQNPVRAGRAGRVARVCVEAGVQVAADSTLMEYED